MNNTPLMKLWIEGEATTSFVSPRFTIPQTERFKLQSIYWPDKTQKAGSLKKQELQIHIDAMKISKMIDEQERQARGGRARATTIHIRPHTTRMNRLTLSERQEQARHLTPQSERVVSRLFVKNPKGQSPRNRDKHGFRNWQIITLEEQQQMNDDKLTRSTSRSQKLDSTKGFSRSKRLDLSRPENFYPGPGTYRIIRYLDQLKRLQKSRQ